MKKAKVSFSKPPKKVQSVIIPATKPPKARKMADVRTYKEDLKAERLRRHREAIKDFPPIKI